MSKTTLNVNAVEIMWDDFYNELYDQLIEPAKTKLAETYKYRHVADKETLQGLLIKASRQTEAALKLVSSLITIDEMVNKKDGEA